MKREKRREEGKQWSVTVVERVLLTRKASHSLVYNKVKTKSQFDGSFEGKRCLVRNDDSVVILMLSESDCTRAIRKAFYPDQADRLLTSFLTCFYCDNVNAAEV